MRSFWILILLSFPAFAKADICFPTIQDTVNVDVIFTGKLVSVSEQVFWNPSARLGFDKVLTFQISESFKGLDSNKAMISIFGPGRGCCLFPLTLDSTYLITAWAYDSEMGIYWTNDCSLSGKLSERMELYELLENPKRHKLSNYEISMLDDIKSFPDSLIMVTNHQNEQIQQLESKKSMHSWLAIFSGLLAACFLILLIRAKLNKRV